MLTARRNWAGAGEGPQAGAGAPGVGCEVGRTKARARVRPDRRQEHNRPVCLPDAPGVRGGESAPCGVSRPARDLRRPLSRAALRRSPQ